MKIETYLLHLRTVSAEVAALPKWKQGGIGCANPGRLSV